MGFGMARPLRIEYAGAFYHVMARGNQGRVNFADDQDRRRCLETPGEACGKAGWRIHAYVLMVNHLKELPKGAPEKTVLVRWLRERTVVSLRWVGRALAMGHYTRVTQAVRRMKRKPARKLQALKRRLLRAEGKHA